MGQRSWFRIIGNGKTNRTMFDKTEKAPKEIARIPGSPHLSRTAVSQGAPFRGRQYTITKTMLTPYARNIKTMRT